MLEQLKTIAKIKGNKVKVTNLEDSVKDIEFVDSDSPELLILNGRVNNAEFEAAVKEIPIGGFIALTRGAAYLVKSIDEAQKIYNDAWRIFVDLVDKGEYVTYVEGIFLYVKGAKREYVKGANDWSTFIKNARPIMMHNFKTWWINNRENITNELQYSLDNGDKPPLDEEFEMIKNEAKELGIHIGRSSKDTLINKIEEAKRLKRHET